MGKIAHILFQIILHLIQHHAVLLQKQHIIRDHTVQDTHKYVRDIQITYLLPFCHTFQDIVKHGSFI